MKLLERTRLIKAYREAYREMAAASGLAKTKAAKQARDILHELGYDVANGKGRVSFPEMSAEDVENLIRVPIDTAKEIKKGERKRAVKEWLQNHLQGKSLIASDGVKIYFNRNDTVSHVAFNAQRNNLIAQCVPFLAEVFVKGEALGLTESDHARRDESIIGFQVYRKWVELPNGYRVYLEAHAAKRKDGEFEFVAYNLKKAAFDSSSTNLPLETALGYQTYQKLLSVENNNAVFDHVQGAAETELFRILKIIDPQGNDVTDSYDESAQAQGGVSAAGKAAELYAFDDTKTKAQRQRDNNAVFELLDKAGRGEITPENITSEQKVVPAKYSGSGGLKARDGKTGSPPVCNP